jgi:hypothetical protein
MKRDRGLVVNADVARIALIEQMLTAYLVRAAQP